MTSGLTLLAEHQEGIVQKIVAKLKTGGQTFRFNRNIPRPTAAQFSGDAEVLCQARRHAAHPEGGGGGGFNGGGGRRRRLRRRRRPRGIREVPACEPAQDPHAVHDAAADASSVLDPPQTNITTTAYTIGGVDQTQPSMGVVTTAQVTKGRFLAPAGGEEALVQTTYAAKHSLKIGSSLNLNGTSFKIVGFVNPALGGQTADVCISR